MQKLSIIHSKLPRLKVKIQNMSQDINHIILRYLNYKGNIVGQKILDNYNIVYIIEFKNHIRIWMFMEEIKII